MTVDAHANHVDDYSRSDNEKQTVLGTEKSSHVANGTLPPDPDEGLSEAERAALVSLDSCSSSIHVVLRLDRTRNCYESLTSN